MTTLFSDDFLRANNASVGANYATTDVLHGITSNECSANTVNTQVSVYNGAVSFPNNQWAQVTIRTIAAALSDEGMGPMVRGIAANTDYYFLQGNPTETRIYRRTLAGGFVQLGSDGPGVASGDVLYLEIVGTQLIAKKNGTVICGSPTDSAIASGKPGIWGGSSGGVCTCDDFLGGNFSAGPSAISYQWQDNSSGTFVDIAGETGSTYTIANVEYRMRGWQFRCVVTDSAGTITSAAATLTVNWSSSDVFLRAVPSDTNVVDVRLFDPTIYTQQVSAAIAEAVTAADTLSATVSAGAALSEVATAADTLAAVATIQAALAEAATAADSIVAGTSTAAALAEAATAADSITAAATLAAALSESVTVADALSALSSLVAALAEAAAAAETLSAIATIVAVLSESVTAADSVTVQTGVVNADVAESVTAADSVDATRTFAVVLAEAVAATDAVSVALNAVAALAEAATATDSVSGGFTAIGALAEAATAADSVTAQRAQNAALAEAATAADTLAALAAFVSAIAEVASATDAVSATAVYPVSLSEAVTAIDQVNSGAGSFTVTLAEAVSAADTIAVTILAVGNLSENANAADTLAAIASLNATLAEAATAGNTINAGSNTFAALTEIAAALDTLSLVPTIVFTVMAKYIVKIRAIRKYNVVAAPRSFNVTTEN